MVFKIKNFLFLCEAFFILRFKILQFFGGGGGKTRFFGVLDTLQSYLCLIS